MNRSQLDQVIEFVSDAIEKHGFECIEAEWMGGTRSLRLFIDRLVPRVEGEGPAIDLDDCARVNRLLVENVELDRFVPGGDYSLEVSSPGIERPLRRRDHFARHIGATIQVKLQKAPGEQILPIDRKHGVGKLVSVGDDVITVDTSQGPWSFPLEQVQKASLVFSWGASK